MKPKLKSFMSCSTNNNNYGQKLERCIAYRNNISQDTLPHFYQVPLHTPLLYTNHSIVTQALPVSLKNLRLRWGGRTVTQTVRFCLFNSAITLHPLIPQKNMPNLSNGSKCLIDDRWLFWGCYEMGTQRTWRGCRTAADEDDLRDIH